ncbi:MAG: hypothetical protein ACI8PV_002009 [Dinoroseobacter sp.]|jgi:hypothetical protein
MKISTKVLISVLGLGLAVLAHTNWLDKVGLRQTEDGLNRALVTYGVSRGLNGVISVVQGTEVAIEPVGIGMTFTPGQILDPVNDLIERFSTVVLISGTAFGIQRVFLEITSSTGFSAFVSFVTVLALLTLWFGRVRFARWRNPIYKVAIIFLIVRFSVPAMAIAGEKFYQVFLAPQFETSSQQLLDTTEQLNKIQQEADSSRVLIGGESPKSLLDSARELYRSATNSLDVRQHLEDFKTAAENVSEHAIRLIVVFIFQTIILPLFSIWLILKTLKWVAMKKPWRLSEN